MVYTFVLLLVFVPAFFTTLPEIAFMASSPFAWLLASLAILVTLARFILGYTGLDQLRDECCGERLARSESN